MNSQDQPILSFEVLRFPFLGSRKVGEPFGYLLMDIHGEKANIAIFKWMVNHTMLILNEKIDLFLPLRLSAVYNRRHDITGTITSVKEEQEIDQCFYEVFFEHPISEVFSTNGNFEQFTKNISSDIDLITLLLRLIKDCIILKQGLLVYFKHFSPYFSRIVNYPAADYHALKSFFFDDITKKITNNVFLLDQLYLSLKETVKILDDISMFLNLEDLREMVESEISFDLFLIAFTSQITGTELVNYLNREEGRKTIYEEDYFTSYLLAIKNLEKRLYYNYNQIVLIYMKSAAM